MDRNERQIREAIAALGLAESQVRLLENAEAAQVAREAEAAFVSTPGLRWWWEALRVPTDLFECPDGDGYLHPLEHVPDSAERCWWIVESEDDGRWIVLSVTPGVLPAIIGECSAFEYYVVSSTFDWLVCENHHNQLVVAARSAPVRPPGLDPGAAGRAPH